MKNLLISVSLLSLVLAGCNMTDFMLPPVGKSSNNNAVAASSKDQVKSLKSATIEEICDVAMKNEARARDTYAHKYTVSAQGEFQYDSTLDIPYVIVKTKKYNVHVGINKDSENWQQYDKNQIASTGIVTVSGVGFREGWGKEKPTCHIHDESSNPYRKR